MAALGLAGSTWLGPGGAAGDRALVPRVQISKLTVADSVVLGASVAISADGNTAVLGSNEGAWVFTRSGSTWTPATLTGTGASSNSYFGSSVALSADGNTALVGGRGYGSTFPLPSGPGAAWVFVRSGSTWTEQAGPLTVSGKSGKGAFGASVALSSNGSTALIGSAYANAAWIFTRSGSTWKKRAKLTTTGAGHSGFGDAVALSGGGGTALVGTGVGRPGGAWVFTGSGATWKKQATLKGSGEKGIAEFGSSVALSQDGNTALVGGDNDDASTNEIENGPGAAWIFARSSGTWTQQGSKLTGSASWKKGHRAGFGSSVSLSADGTTALVGAPFAGGEVGSAWEFMHSSSGWASAGTLTTTSLVGTAEFGSGVALSRDGTIALVGGPQDSSAAGAVWAFGSVSSSATTSTTTTPPATTTTATSTIVTVTTGSPGTYTFTLSTSAQPKVVSDTPHAAELNVPPGEVVFNVANTVSGILSHTFEICTTPLAKPVTTLPQVQALPNSCIGDVTPLIAPGGASETLKVDLTTPGAYEYLSTANNPEGDAFSGMKGVLNVT